MASITNPAMAHAHSAELAMFIRGRLPSDQADSICEHVLVCGICQGEVQEITQLLWPSLSPWIKCWLRLYSPSSPPSRLLQFLQRTFGRVRRTNAFQRQLLDFRRRG
jgi:hypothetical protein